MEIGGLMAQAFKLFLGNPDVMAVLLTWLVFSTLILTVLAMRESDKT